MIAITGGSGFIGSHLAGKLLGNGERVRILDIRKPSASHPARSSFVKCDVRSRQQLAKCLRGCSSVFHLAALIDVQSSISSPAADFNTNATGTMNTLFVSRELGIRRVVYTSSAAVYGKPLSLPVSEEHPAFPISPYGASKYAGEQYCRVFAELYPLEAVSLRLFNVYGSGQNPKSPYSGVITKFAERMRQGKQPLIFGDGRQTRDFVFVEDVASALMLAMRSKKANAGIINIGSGKQTTIEGLAREMAGILGKKLAPVHAAARKGDIKNSVADISKAKALLGFRPKFSLKQGLSFIRGG